MHITFLLPVVGLPRHHKRIRALRRAGAKVRILAFSRPDQLGAPRDETVEVMGVIRDRAYGERAATFLRAVRFLRRELRQTDVVYCFGVDLLALARAALAFSSADPKRVVEVGDIVPAMVAGGSRSALARRTEKLLIGTDTLLVSTAPGYVSGYYEGELGLADLESFVIENKVDPETVPPLPSSRVPAPGVLRIGYFGQIRCPRSWDVLTSLARAGGDRVQIVVRGFAKGEMLDRIGEAAELPNMEYLGRYEVPTDLARIYSEVDVSWMAFWDANEQTWQWARSNRFYESGYFSTPMIGQAGKDDTRLVERHDVGIAVDVTRPAEAVERVLAIRPDDLSRWRSRLDDLPPSTFALTDEHTRLLAQLEADVRGPV